ncbi:MAG: hypothetical protein JJE52_04260 [Acidimicrobiia bacterium]|nr:hypothetical protein [Acidimicrobiia bacterium]
MQRAVANVVVGQMVPPSVVKGGTAMKLRVGESGSRFTPDFDATRHANVTVDDYLDDLRGRLAGGWGGFTGTVEQLDPPQPHGVPDEYVMQPFQVRLSYQGRHWLSVTFELGHDEIGSTASSEKRIAADLVDLQILIEEEPFEPTALRPVCERLFRARQSQPWPPTVVAYPAWPSLYAEAADGLGVITNVDEAVTWANDLIAAIATT